MRILPALMALAVVSLETWAVVAADEAPLAPPGAAKPAALADPLVVHEWGTFTSVHGVDGVGLK